MSRRSPPLIELYDALLARFGPQGWWPGESPTEVAIGAVLVQNTSWRNVEHALTNLRSADLLDLSRLAMLDQLELERLIQPAGFYRVKARRLRNLLDFLAQSHQGALDSLFRLPLSEARRQLLSVSGIGPETADSILLYGGGLPKFVVDAYTRRVLVRHGWMPPGVSYHEMQQLFESQLEPEPQLFNEYHALIVRLGYHHCKAQPQCLDCPLACYLPRSGPYPDRAQ
jgi:endonuclease III related protein